MRFGSSELEFIEHLIVTKSWWDTVDGLASHIVGSVFYKNNTLRDQWCERWVESQNLWLQRSSLIFQLKYNKETDFPMLTRQIELLKSVDDFFIQKAIGWSLRQYGKYHPEAVRAYVDISDLSSLATREALKSQDSTTNVRRKDY